MRRELKSLEGAPVRLVEFTRAFYVGGTEVQVVELLRGLPSDYQIQVAVLDKKGQLLSTVEGLGYQPHAFPLSGSVARPNTALQILRMARWLREERVQLVHVHDFYSTIVAVPAARLAGVKVIVGRLDLCHWHTPTMRAILSNLTRMADHVVANAMAIKEQLITEEQLTPSGVTVIPNGIDLKRFDARMSETLSAPLPPELGPVIVHVANMNHPVKRQEDLLAAMTILRHKVPQAQAWLVGDGARRPELERLARTLGLTRSVHFLGIRDDVPAILSRATVGVLCSSAEGLPNAVMEGMAARLPMVVTRVGANPDLIRDGVNGRVVERHRPAELARALLEVISNEAEARRMGLAARGYVERELTLELLAKRHDSMYREVLGDGPFSSVQGSGDETR